MLRALMRLGFFGSPLPVGSRPWTPTNRSTVSSSLRSEISTKPPGASSAGKRISVSGVFEDS